MGLFRKKGIDLNLLRKTKYWDDVAKMVELDKDTHQKLVQYIYETVSDSLINEVEKSLQEVKDAPTSDHMEQYLTRRGALLKIYKGEKNG